MVLVGLVEMARLTPTMKAEVEGEAVFHESWLYRLADDIKVDIIEIAVKTAHPEKVYSAGDSSAGVNLQKKNEKKKVKKKHEI